MKTLLTVCLFALSFAVSLAQEGSIDPTFNTQDAGWGFGDGANGRVAACLKQPDGKIIIAGAFNNYNFSIASSIDRLNVDGTPDPGFNGGLADSVFALALAPDGKILVGGRFDAWVQGPVSGITRLNADGTQDASFVGTGTHAAVYAVAVQADGKVLIGGNFTDYSGNGAVRIARLNTDGTLDNTFSAGSGPNGRVRAIDIQSDGKVVIAGEFTSVNGIGRGRIARLNANGTLDTGFGTAAGTDGRIRAMVALPDGRRLIGGDFSMCNGQSRSRLALLNTDGSLDASFVIGSGANGNVHSVCRRANGILAVGGAFTSFNGTTRKHLALIGTNGALEASFDPQVGPNAPIYTVIESMTTHLFIGGDHTAYRDDQTGCFSRIDNTGTFDTAFNHATTGVNGGPGYVNVLAEQPDGKILFAGIFHGYAGKAHNGIARCLADGSLDTSFDPGTPVPTGGVDALVLQPDGKILIGGWFTDYNGVSRNRIARLNSDGSLDAGFDPGLGANSDVKDMVLLPDGKILVAGSFTSYNGNASPFIARLNPNGGYDNTFNTGTGPNSTVSCLTVQPDGRIVIGGNFSSCNDISCGRIARLNSNGDLDVTFDPGTGANNYVNDVSLEPDGKILITGQFITFNGSSRQRLTRLNTNGSLDNTYSMGTGLNGTGKRLHRQPDGKTILTGSFSQYNGITRQGMVRLNPNGSQDMSLLSSNGGTGIEVALVLSTGQLMIGGWFVYYGSTDENPVGRNRLARLTGTNRTHVDVMLEGPHAGGTMTDALRTLPSFPLTEPFSALGYTEAVYIPGASISSSVLATTGNNAIVDWVIVEMRPAAAPSMVAASRAVLIQRDGDVVDLDGISTVGFSGLASGNYCVAVLHRNHLPVMSSPSTPVAFGNGIATVDFTLPSTVVYDDDARKNIGGVMMLAAGDVNFDGTVRYTGDASDRDLVLLRIGGVVPTATLAGYWPEDANMDGVVKYTGIDNDRDVVLRSIGGIIPTNTRSASLP